MKIVLLSSLLAIAPLLSGCNRGSAGPREVHVKVSDQGYTPKRIAGRPGEQLKLVFHYEPSAGACGREVVLPAGAQPQRATLSPEKPVTVALALPQKGELTFTCGMNMLRGTVVVD